MSSRRWTEPEVEDRVLEPERAASISGAVAEPCEPERDAIVSAFYGERTYRQAGLVLGVSERTGKSRIRTALVRLRAALVNLPGRLDDHAA
jgi:RNA polymerase sigma-70 factor (ECF subfamily)